MFGNDGFPTYALTTAAVSSDGTRLYVVAHETNAIIALDLTKTPPSQIAAPIPVGNCPQYLALSPDGRHLYVSETGAGTLGVIDTTLIGNAPFPEIADISIGGKPAGVAVTPDGNSVWVADQFQRVAIVDTNPNDATYDTIVNQYSVAYPYLVGISSDGAKAYITSNRRT
jgi:YVTN family beta-propeller protein